MNILITQLTKLTPTIRHCLIDVEIAKTILSDRNYENQRRLKPSSVSQYAESMEMDDWSEISIIRFGCSTENSQWRLTDGQHRLHAIVKSNLPQTFKIEFDTFESELDLKEAYGKMDRGVPRTDMDAMLVYGDSRLAPGEMNRFIAAIKLIDSGFTARRIEKFPATRLRKLFVEWEPYAVKVQELRSQCNVSRDVREPLRRSSMISVFMFLIRYAKKQSQAESFIRSIYEDSGLITNDPRKHVVEMVKKFNVRNGRNFNAVTLDSRDLAGFTIACWNLFASGKKTCRRPNFSGNGTVFVEVEQPKAS